MRAIWLAGCVLVVGGVALPKNKWCAHFLALANSSEDDSEEFAKFLQPWETHMYSC